MLFKIALLDVRPRFPFAAKVFSKALLNSNVELIACVKVQVRPHWVMRDATPKYKQIFKLFSNSEPL